MSTLSLLGYVIAMCLAPVAPFVAVRWYRRIVSVTKALRVLSRERRAGESFYDAAEAIAGDAHNWRGIVDVRVRDTTVNLVAPQPAPQNQSSHALWPMIIAELGDSKTDLLVAADMLARHEFGMAKYGVPLVALNGRDHLVDAYQEVLDGVVYLRAAFDEQANATHHDHELSRSGCINGLPELGKSRVAQLYIDMLDLAKESRELILARDGK